jgi:hypothetical protein
MVCGVETTLRIELTEDQQAEPGQPTHAEKSGPQTDQSAQLTPERSKPQP